MDISTACAEWLASKETEKAAIEHRRELEDTMLSLLGVAESLDGTDTFDLDSGYKIKVVGRMNRKVDSDIIQEIAAENGLTAHLQSLFRWKPELNLSAWKSADKSITDVLIGGITTSPGRPSFSITME